jgi:hypothetical protein
MGHDADDKNYPSLAKVFGPFLVLIRVNVRQENKALTFVFLQPTILK